MRRAILLSLGACLIGHAPRDMYVAVIGEAHAQTAEPTPPPTTLPRSVQRRLELWRKPADTGLGARYQLTRRSSLLYEPLTAAGALTFTPPDRLELRDDDPSGAITQITGTDVTITANGAAPGPALGDDAPGRRWLRTHLIALLAAQDPEALQLDARVRNLRGPGTSIELTPPPGHAAGRTIRELRVQLDPNSGEILLLVLVEAGGDMVTISLAQHRRAD